MAKDLFSNQSSFYAAYRPLYPKPLYDYLLQKVSVRDTAWDCATGNGQVAIELSKYFKNVFATDISENQLAAATPGHNIHYSRQPAERTSFPRQFFDLITVAQAYHWFDFDAFQAEVKRISRPGALIAVWGYHLPKSTNDNVNTLINYFYSDVTGPYWDPERKWVDDFYQTIPFSYEDTSLRQFSIRTLWNREQFLGYFRSWSSVQHYMKEKNEDPVLVLAREIDNYWGSEELKEITFPLFLKTGTVR
jgi:ubiquinone/menaquinone biosynthesis C-methylase UbiE